MENLKSLTDEQLAYRYIAGNNRAFDELLKRNQTKLFNYILFVVHDQALADDIFQETFVKVIDKLHHGKYTDSGKFSAWITRIAHNVIMDYYREQQNEMMVTPTEDFERTRFTSRDILDTNIENDIVYRQTLHDVEKIMNCLPAPQREVVYMRFYQELSFKEIAELTNVSINTALGRMRYAVLNMRRLARENKVALPTF